MLREAEKIYTIISQLKNITEKQIASILDLHVSTIRKRIPFVLLIHRDVIVRKCPRQYCIQNPQEEIPNKILGNRAAQCSKDKQQILDLLKNSSGLSCSEITSYLSIGTKGKIRNLLYKLRKEKKIYMKKILPKKWIYLIQDDFENKDSPWFWIHPFGYEKIFNHLIFKSQLILKRTG